MPAEITAAVQGKKEQDLVDQWVRSADFNEIGLLDLVVLNEWITQLPAEGGSGCPE